jgi:hypothetical protein
VLMKIKAGLGVKLGPSSGYGDRRHRLPPGCRRRGDRGQ